MASVTSITKHGAHGEPGASSQFQFRTIRDAVWACREIKGSSKLIALRLVEHWPRIFPSLRSLCEFTGLKERAVRKAIRELERVGVIVTTPRPGSTSTYAFPGVSIPALGGVSRGGPPPAEYADPAPVQKSPPPPTKRAPHPLPKEPPKQINLSRQTKQGRSARERAAPAPAVSMTRRSDPKTWRHLNGWTPSAKLRQEARALGLTDATFDRRIARLRNSPIGGRDGVFDRDVYVSGLLEDWQKWEAERKNTDSSGGTGANFAFQGGAAKPGHARLPGLPAWIYPEHKKVADAAGLDLKQCAQEFSKQCAVKPSQRPPCDVFQPFLEYLRSVIKAKASKPAPKKRRAA
jgi:helix-turn-helix protein